MSSIVRERGSNRPSELLLACSVLVLWRGGRDPFLTRLCAAALLDGVDLGAALIPWRLVFVPNPVWP